MEKSTQFFKESSPTGIFTFPQQHTLWPFLCRLSYNAHSISVDWWGGHMGVDNICISIYPLFLLLGSCLVLFGDILERLKRRGNISWVQKPFIATCIINLVLWVDFNITVLRRKPKNMGQSNANTVSRCGRCPELRVFFVDSDFWRWHIFSQAFGILGRVTGGTAW